MEKQLNKKVFTGIIGAIIGAFIGTIPSILAYNYGNILMAVASLPISVASYYGYKMTKSKINRKIYIIICATSAFAVTIASFIIVPGMYLLSKGYKASFENLELVYNIPGVEKAIIRDYLISLICMLQGFIGMAAYIKKKCLQTIELSQNTVIESDQNAIVQEELSTNSQAEESERNINTKNVERRNKKSIVLVISGLIVSICFIVLLGIGLGKKDTNSTEITQNQKQNIIEEIDVQVNELEHIIPDTGLKFVPKDNIKILTKKQIEDYFGTNVGEYEIIAMDETKNRMLYMLIDEGEDAKKLDMSEYLRETFGDSEEVEITDITIADIGFKKAMIQLDEDVGNYTLVRYICKINDKYLVFDYCYPTGEENSFETMIVKE